MKGLIRLQALYFFEEGVRPEKTRNEKAVTGMY
jgi:hypothetical protein